MNFIERILGVEPNEALDVKTLYNFLIQSGVDEESASDVVGEIRGYCIQVKFYGAIKVVQAVVTEEPVGVQKVKEINVEGISIFITDQYWSHSDYRDIFIVV